MAIVSNEVLGQLGTLFLEELTKSNTTKRIPLSTSIGALINYDNCGKAPLVITNEIRIPFMKLRSKPIL